MQLENLLGSKTKITLLRQFSKGQDYTVAELARELKMDKSIVSRSISSLEEHNLVLVRRRGTLKICSLNEDAKISNELKALFSAEKRR